MPEKILVVDDDIDSLKLIGLMLQRHGYDVSAANAGHQAIVKATAEKPDLIILDVMMPDMNGYEVCRRLRASAETQAIPIIMFTAKTLIDDKVAGFEAGADDYLTKPTHPAELASRVRAILARRPVARQGEASRGAAIGVLGIKGGVGVTTLAVNLAAAIHNSDGNPLLVDMRLGSGSMGLQLGVPKPHGIAEVLAKPAADLKPKTIEENLTVHNSGLRGLFSSPSLREAQLGYSLEAGIALTKQVRAMGRTGLFDLGTPLSPNAIRLQRELDLLIFVVEPMKATLAAAREILPQIESTRSVPGRIHLVVVNRAQSGLQTPWHEVEQILGQEIRAIISSAPELTYQATNVGMPMVMHQPSAIVSTQINKLAEDLTARVHAEANNELAS
jgi:CheY-like chemotaxis protein/MinD-like ATPase involved in chromosome partitioning or flagellar assembly